MAKVGYDRVKEIENLELGQERMPWCARIETEKEIGKKVIVKKNYLNWGDRKKLN